MDEKLYSIGLRDLFRWYCNKEKLSAERICDDIVSYFYDDPDCADANELHENLSKEIGKLRYPPNGKGQRDRTFENSKIIEYVASYLTDKEPIYSYALAALRKTYLLHIAFNQHKEVAHEEKRAKKKFDSYASFYGTSSTKSFPNNLGYIINSNQYRPDIQGILICFESFNSKLRFSKELLSRVEPYDIVSLKFFVSEKPHSAFESTIETHDLEECCQIHFIGIFLPSNDNTVVLKDFINQKTYLAKFQYTDAGKFRYPILEWEFINEFTQFNQMFKCSDVEKRYFPTMKRTPILGQRPQLDLEVHSANTITDEAKSTLHKLLINKIKSTFGKFKQIVPLLYSYTSNLVHAFRYNFFNNRNNKDIFELITFSQYEDAIDMINKDISLVNSTNEAGNTPVFLAIHLGANPVIEKFIDTGKVDYSHKNKSGENILDFVAMSHGLKEKTRRQIIKISKSKH